MNDEQTAKYLKGLATEKPKAKVAPMTLRVDPDLKYLMDLLSAHQRRTLVNAASTAMWLYLDKHLDPRLIQDEHARRKLEAWHRQQDTEAAKSPAAETASSQDGKASSGPGSLVERLKSRET